MDKKAIKSQAIDLFTAWNGKGFFIDFYSKETGFYMDSEEYAYVYELLMHGIIK